MIPQVLISILGVIAVVIIAFYGFTTGGYFVHALLLGTPVFLFLVNNPSLWLVLIIGLMQSKLIFPGIPQGLQVVHVMMAAFTAVMMARNIIVKPNVGSAPWSTRFLVGFLVVLIITAYFRGFGIRALGGDTWGGMAYVKIFLAAGFLLVSRYIRLTPAQIKGAIFLMIGLSLLPFAAQMLFLISKGRIYQQYMFVEAYVSGLLGSLNAAQSGTGVVRFHAISSVSFSLLTATLVFVRPEGLRQAFIGLMIMLCLLMTGFSGFRSQIVTMLAVVGLYAIFLQPKQAAKRMLLAGGLIIFGIAAVYPFIGLLPTPIQRALSFLPGADIRVDVMIDATFSTEWRLRIWRMAWEEIPRYLIVGKGLAFDPSETLTFTALKDGVLAAFLAHNYHSGPLSLLLDTGIFGFVFASLFMIASAVEVCRDIHSSSAFTPLVRRFYLYTAASYVFAVPSFFFIFGDLQNILPHMLTQLAALTAVRYSLREDEITKLAEQRTRKAAPPKQRTNVVPVRPRRLTT